MPKPIHKAAGSLATAPPLTQELARIADVETLLLGDLSELTIDWAPRLRTAGLDDMAAALETIQRRIQENRDDGMRCIVEAGPDAWAETLQYTMENNGRQAIPREAD